MDAKIILKNNPKQKYLSRFPADNQCLQYEHLTVYHDVNGGKDQIKGLC